MFVAQTAATLDATWRVPALALASGALLALSLGGALALFTARGVLVPVRRLEAYARGLGGPSRGGSAAALPPAGVTELETLRLGFIAAEAALTAREAAVREGEAQLRAIFDETPVGLGLMDAGLRFVQVNNRLAEFNGARVADHIGHTPSEVLPSGDGTELEAIVRRVL